MKINRADNHIIIILYFPRKIIVKWAHLRIVMAEQKRIQIAMCINFHIFDSIGINKDCWWDNINYYYTLLHNIFFNNISSTIRKNIKNKKLIQESKNNFAWGVYKLTACVSLLSKYTSFIMGLGWFKKTWNTRGGCGREHVHRVDTQNGTQREQCACVTHPHGWKKK